MSDIDVQFLEGCPIQEELEVKDLQERDKFVVSVPLNGQSKSNFYRSGKTTYKNIRDSIYGAVFGNMNLGTMATEDKDGYAKKDHNHFGRYSRVEVIPHYFRNYSVPEDEDQVIVLGHIVIDGVSRDICVPNVNGSSAKNIVKNRIGTLKFVAAPKLPPINENLDGFDGWVYPDGREVSIKRFPYAYEKFKTIQTGTEAEGKFRIPNFQDFFKANPFVETDDPLKRVGYNVSLKNHTHDISQFALNGTYSLSGNFKTYGESRGIFTGRHHGTGNQKRGTIQADIRFDMSGMTVESADITQNPAVDSENFPTHFNIPVLIYIGVPV